MILTNAVPTEERSGTRIQKSAEVEVETKLMKTLREAGGGNRGRKREDLPTKQKLIDDVKQKLMDAVKFAGQTDQACEKHQIGLNQKLIDALLFVVRRRTELYEAGGCDESKKGKDVKAMHEFLLDVQRKLGNLDAYEVAKQSDKPCEKLKLGLKEKFTDALRFVTRDEKGTDAAWCYHSKTGIFNIPTAMRQGNKPLPAGTLDLTALLHESKREPRRKNGKILKKKNGKTQYTRWWSSSTSFQIPDAQWLVDNRWIDSAQIDDGPFFVKQLQLYPLLPPGYRSLGITRFSVSNNTDVTAKFEYSPYGWQECKTPKVDGPYYCDRNDYRASFCAVDSGNFDGPPYPSLMNKWKVDLSLEYGKKRVAAPFPVPGPVGRLYLKVAAEICFDKKNRETIARRSHDYHRVNSPSSLIALCGGVRYNCGRSWFSNHPDECWDCPRGSRPRHDGYYCESCPAGFEPCQQNRFNSGIGFGCVPCKVAYYKDQPGNHRCEKCPWGQCTNGTGSTTCFDNPNDYEYDYERLRRNSDSDSCPKVKSSTTIKCVA